MKLFDHEVFALTGVLLAACASTGYAQQHPDQAVSRVQVEYLHPENFTDVRERYYPDDKARDFYLNALRRHIQRRAAGYVQEGQSLVVSITEVDMAGNFEPLRTRLADVRIVRDVCPPRIDLVFKWTDSGGTVLKQGERKLRDLAFMTGAHLYRGDPLRYEKALLDDWLDREFRPPPT